MAAAACKGKRAAEAPATSPRAPQRPRSDVDGTQGGEGEAEGAKEAQQQRVPAVRLGRTEWADGKACTHEVSLPPEDEETAVARREATRSRKGRPRATRMAKEYAFPLDPFQEQSVACLEDGESVLVAAHTSAGKTVVAEYAIAMALRDGERCVYTSPLKALSNQKFRELQEEFGDVGLLTGDNTVNPNASCLVMTTEILRSMLYRGSELVSSCRWLIMDEIHYMRDRERGVVWEESIALAPRGARFVFLSATIPNAPEFAGWVAKLHRQPCHVVYTDYRPTPLEHYLFPTGGEGIYLVVDREREFREENFERAIAAMESAARERAERRAVEAQLARDSAKGAMTAGGTRGPSDIYRLVSMIMKKGFDPVIVFAFSKKECDSLSKQMADMDLVLEGEREMVDQIFESAVTCLEPQDRALPQVAAMLPMLRRGIGVHHSGLLPILKEVVEILFQEGFLKVLFATETFSTGLNMPAKTVVFTNVRKFDGEGFRWISGGEYIQMSGRAGRRGKDDRGVVILMLDNKMQPATAKGMVKGKSDPLFSAFHVSFSMLINMARSAASVEPEALVAKTFAQYQAERAMPELLAKAERLEHQRAAIDVGGDEAEAAALEYLACEAALRKARHRRRVIELAPQHSMPYLQAGRLARVTTIAAGGRGSEEEEAHWGIIVGANRSGGVASSAIRAAGAVSEGGGGSDDDDTEAVRISAAVAAATAAAAAHTVEVLCFISTTTEDPTGRGSRVAPAATLVAPPPRGAQPPPGVEAQVVSLPLLRVSALSALRVRLPPETRSPEGRARAGSVLCEVLKRVAKGGGPKPLESSRDLGVDAPLAEALRGEVARLEQTLQGHPMLADASDRRAALVAVRERERLRTAAEQARSDAAVAGGLILRDEIAGRRGVLRRLGYISTGGVVQLKGHVAAELGAASDELVMCELIFSGALQALPGPLLAAAASVMAAPDRKAGKDAAGLAQPRKRMREDLERVYEGVHAAAKVVGRAMVECNASMADADDFARSFAPDPMEVTALWAAGAQFTECLKLAGGFEGALVRSLRRTEELMRQMGAGARRAGEEALAEALDDARELVLRGIVSAPSLYL